MGFTKVYNKDFYIEDNCVKLSKDYLKNNISKFKKITGSRFASILGYNQFCSPFKTWCIMTNIFVDVMDDTLLKAGTIIEPKIHKLICKKLGVNFLQYNPIDIKWDVFKENEIFGGIPDGEPIDDKGNFLYPDQPMLEIKTTSIDSFVYKKSGNDFVLQKDSYGNPLVKKEGEKRLKWFDSNSNILVPNEYKFQLGLYCYLRNITKGIFAICFLETNDYINPKECNVEDRELRIVRFEIDRKDFERFIKFGQDWYNNYIKSGISPKLSSEDLKWFDNEEK